MNIPSPKALVHAVLLSVCVVVIVWATYVGYGCWRHSGRMEKGLFMLSKAKIAQIAAQSYSVMMSQSGTPLWDNRKDFTNYVLRIYLDGDKPMMEIQLTDGDFNNDHGYRFHRCQYDSDTDTVSYKVGMCSAVE